MRIDQTDHATRHLLLHSSGGRFVSGRDDTALRDLLDTSGKLRDSHFGLRTARLTQVTRTIRRCRGITEDKVLVRRC